MKRNILILIVSLLLVGCQGDIVYTVFKSLPNVGWEADSSLCYQPVITDSVADYQMLITIRHTDAYPYQNLWLFVDIEQDSLLLTRDTIECYMANERGEWLGGGLTVHELPLLYSENYRFANSGEYQISITQGMREDTLVGIKEVGVKIIRNEQK
jgi:gliding motility-associated lipoprotein GldH